jgi:hypothetical protein
MSAEPTNQTQTTEPNNHKHTSSKFNLFFPFISALQMSQLMFFEHFIFHRHSSTFYFVFQIHSKNMKKKDVFHISAVKVD